VSLLFSLRLERPIDNEIHVWSACASELQDYLSSLSEVLSTAELARANSFVSSDNRKRCIFSRGILRILLGRYLGVSAHDVALKFTELGRPVLEAAQLSFSISHSGRKLLWGFAPDGKIGVDIEQVRQRSAYLASQSWLSAREQQQIESVQDVNKMTELHRCWVRKESVLKALGVGINYELGSIDTVNDRLVVFDKLNNLNVDFTLTMLPSEPRYLAALASSNSAANLKCFDFAKTFSIDCEPSLKHC